MLLIEKNTLNEAEECFIKIIKYKPEFAEAYYNLGIIYGKLSRFDLAEVNYKKALEYTEYNAVIREAKSYIKSK